MRCCDHSEPPNVVLFHLYLHLRLVRGAVLAAAKVPEQPPILDLAAAASSQSRLRRRRSSSSPRRRRSSSSPSPRPPLRVLATAEVLLLRVLVAAKVLLLRVLAPRFFSESSPFPSRFESSPPPKFFFSESSPFPSRFFSESSPPSIIRL